MQINELARAKVNLCLHVTGQREDGYHLLDSIVVFADTGDLISIAPSDAFSLTINGPFADRLSAGPDNLALQAAKQFSKYCKGADITLTKNLPVASGIGGGSADAAATIRAMSRMTGEPIPRDNGLSLGADVPVCLQSASCRMKGIGDVITKIADFPNFPAILVCPKSGVATASVFSAIDNKHNAPISEIPVTDLTRPKVGEYLCRQRNDLEGPSVNINKEISACLELIKQQGGFLARMSGSGATCFGLFESMHKAEKAALTIATAQPDWWVKPCMLGN
jgi:4-diphosphocytidyl-2-C-methyl-D-erythritol kinase